jgi:hypothetical protein
MPTKPVATVSPSRISETASSAETTLLVLGRVVEDVGRAALSVNSKNNCGRGHQRGGRDQQLDNGGDQLLGARPRRASPEIDIDAMTGRGFANAADEVLMRVVECAADSEALRAASSLSGVPHVAKTVSAR